MNENNVNKQWYVLYVNVRHEKKVFEKLQEKKIESYLPMVTRMKQWSDRKKKVEEPLFTGYVFVKLLEHELDKPLYVSGVLNYLAFGKQKAIVKQSEIDNLQYLISNGYQLNGLKQDIQVGEKVKITMASFKDEIAVVQKLIQNKAILFFEGLKLNLQVTLPVEALEKL